MSDTNWVRDRKPDVGQQIIAIVRTSSGTEVASICFIDRNDDVLNLSCNLKWFSLSDIERWCPLDVALEAIGG